ncbi:MAG TPA: hypothetical protein VK604_18620 [Bryobacteraceae bacterium]|nr:hypothetical protein [Bryobacteraceae bacterium]
MRIKSYFTDSVEEAIERARLELGLDALLMNSKKTDSDLQALGAYEVVFGVPSDVASSTDMVLPGKITPAPGELTTGKKRRIHPGGAISKGLSALIAATVPAFAAGNRPIDGGPADDQTALDRFSADSFINDPVAANPFTANHVNTNHVNTSHVNTSHVNTSHVNTSHVNTNHAGARSQELAALREQIETVERSMLRQMREWTARATGIAAEEHNRAGGSSRTEPKALETSRRLVSSGFGEELAGEIAEAVEIRLSLGPNADATPEQRAAALYSELAGRFTVAPPLSFPETGRAVLFAGPGGAGKSSALLKLALRHSLGARIPLQILSLDTLRVGGWEQVAGYARIAGLPFDVIHNLAGLGQALDEHRGRKLILIDMPGLSPAEWRDTPDLAAWVVRETALEVQLVLPAVLRPLVAQRALEQFGALRPAKLLLTHMDEVDGPGAALELAMRSGLPLSYLASGQQIPEDLEEASRERLLEPFAAAAQQTANLKNRQVATAA